MKTHKAKRVEITIEAIMQSRLSDALVRAGVTGFTVLPFLCGSGRSGAWVRSGEIGRASGMVQVICIIRPDRLDELLVLDFAGDEAMQSTFATLHVEAAADRAGSRAMTSALLQECLIRILREVCTDDRCAAPWLDALDDPTLAPALEAMLGHPEAPHTVASLAAGAFMSRSAFARRFREHVGQPPLQYLRGIRLRHAAKLLRKSPPLPVATVARRSGFSSRSQFSRAFSAYFGRPPSEFRD